MGFNVRQQIIKIYYASYVCKFRPVFHILLHARRLMFAKLFPMTGLDSSKKSHISPSIFLKAELPLNLTNAPD